MTLTSAFDTHFKMMRRPFLILGLALSLLVGSWLIGIMQPAVPEAAPAAPVERSSASFMARMEERLQQNPDDTHAYAQLGLAFLQQVRENGDPVLYTQAQNAFEEALERDPNQLDALVGQGVLALALHDFTGALDWAEQAWAINPFRAQILGIMVDAQVELGRYEEAVETLQRMVDLRPDLHSYSRISYLRELHGDMDGAISAMAFAVGAGLPGTEEMLWSQVELGHLYFKQGDLAQAEASYREALQLRPDYIPAKAALARIQAAQGELAGAIETYREVTQRLPLPEYVIALGILYESVQETGNAQQQYELVTVMQKLNANAGMDVDLEMALFNAEQGDNLTLAEKQARATYAKRPIVQAADTLAWVLYQNGHYVEAAQYSEEALRLGTQYAEFYYHAGMIAYALEDMETARQHLEKALSINPHFSLLGVAQAEKTLALIQ